MSLIFVLFVASFVQLVPRLGKMLSVVPLSSSCCQVRLLKGRSLPARWVLLTSLTARPNISSRGLPLRVRMVLRAPHSRGQFVPGLSLKPQYRRGRQA